MWDSKRILTVQKVKVKCFESVAPYRHTAASSEQPGRLLCGVGDYKDPL